MMKNYRETDPEFVERVEHFAFDEVVNEPGQQLDEAFVKLGQVDESAAAAAASAQAAAQSARDARQAAESLTGLPAVTEADNGKFLRVAGGVWAAEAVPSAEEASF